MNQQQKLKAIGYVFLLILVLNLVLFALKLITTIVFWAIILVGALFVYKILPRLKK